MRIGRKEIGPSYNDYCRLCGLCFNVQYENTGRNIGFEKMFKPESISVQNNNYSECVCCQCASKIGHCMTVSLLSSLSCKKKNPTILIKQSKSTSRGEH